MAVWTDWGMIPDDASPTKFCLVRFKDGDPRAKATIVTPDLMQGWLSATGRISNFGRRDGEDDMEFFIRVAVTLDRALAKEGAPAAWHKLQLALEQEIEAAKDEGTGERVKTFGELRKAVLERAGVKDHFSYRELSVAHGEFWDRMNAVEYERGYDREEYLKPGSPALCEMKLLTAQEYEQWLADSPEP